MDIKIKNRDGVKLLTGGKYCEEDINITLADSLFDYTNEDGLVTRTLTSYYNDRVTSVGSRAFYQWTTLESIDFPNLEEVADLAFYGCNKLINVNMPKVKYIKASAFNNCTALIEVSMPNVEILGDQCFRYCSSVEIFYLPKVNSIVGAVFAQCTSIKALIIEQTDSVVVLNSSTCFNSSGIQAGTGYIYVPDSLIDSYKSATNWSTYADQIKPLSELPEEE